MAFHSTENAATASVFSREVKKKKNNRNYRTAKLKQCKLDARREQWLSQVKNKSNKEPEKGGPLPLSLIGKENESSENIGRRLSGENGGSNLHESDLESPTHSMGSRSLSSDHMSRKEQPRSSSSSHSSSSGVFFGSLSQDDEEDGSLDNWETVADALTADDDHCHQDPQSGAESETTTELTVPLEFPKKGVMKLEDKGMIFTRAAAMNCRAWKPDDALRPHGLPNLPTQYQFPKNNERHCGHGTTNWTSHGMKSPPSPCPICYEDLDLTDSSFLPCSCGFRLCLFCHKRILEADGRCPGCRKQYGPVNVETGVNGGSMPLCFPHFISMSRRS